MVISAVSASSAAISRSLARDWGGGKRVSFRARGRSFVAVLLGLDCHGDRAVDAIRQEVEPRPRPELVGQGALDELAAIASPRVATGHDDAAFPPVQHDQPITVSLLDTPKDCQAAGILRQRPVLHGIGGELVQAKT